MAKRGRNKTQTPRSMADYIIPVYIPTEGGYGDLELGKARMVGQSLVIEFNNKLPSVAIQQRIARGGIVGVTFVIPEEEAEYARQTEADLEKQRAEEAERPEETEEERRLREEAEEQQAKVDQVFLEAELDRLEED